MTTAPSRAKPIRFQDAAVAAGNGTELNVASNLSGSYEYLGIQVSGTFAGTITFECTVDGSTWVALGVRSAGATSTLVTTATVPGVFLATVAGLKKIRARISAYTSGTIEVDGLAVA